MSSLKEVIMVLAFSNRLISEGDVPNEVKLLTRVLEKLFRLKPLWPVRWRESHTPYDSFAIYYDGAYAQFSLVSRRTGLDNRTVEILSLNFCLFQARAMSHEDPIARLDEKRAEILDRLSGVELCEEESRRDVRLVEDTVLGNPEGAMMLHLFFKSNALNALLAN